MDFCGLEAKDKSRLGVVSKQLMQSRRLKNLAELNKLYQFTKSMQKHVSGIGLVTIFADVDISQLSHISLSQYSVFKVHQNYSENALIFN